MTAVRASKEISRNQASRSAMIPRAMARAAKKTARSLTAVETARRAVGVGTPREEGRRERMREASSARVMRTSSNVEEELASSVLTRTGGRLTGGMAGYARSMQEV